MVRLPLRGLLGAGLEDGALYVETTDPKRVLENLDPLGKCMGLSDSDWAGLGPVNPGEK